jgi:hypothetical protein
MYVTAACLEWSWLKAWAMQIARCRGMKKGDRGTGSPVGRDHSLLADLVVDCASKRAVACRAIDVFRGLAAPKRVEQDVLRLSVSGRFVLAKNGALYLWQGNKDTQA